MLTNEQHNMVMELINIAEERTRFEAAQAIFPGEGSTEIDIFLAQLDKDAHFIWGNLNA
jgi:hypothetical protein